MKISKQILEEAVKRHLLESHQLGELWDFLESREGDEPKFNFTNVLYYLGGFLAIGAMTIFMNLGWESFGGWGIVGISVIYAIIGLQLVTMFARKDYKIPAGICATFVVALTPLAIYGFQQAIGIWPSESEYHSYHKLVSWHWVYMEMGSLIVGVVVAWKYKYPFLTMPIAITLWYLSMDMTPFLFGGTLRWEMAAFVSIYFGIIMILIAFWVDVRTIGQADYAFWLYIFGVFALWGGMMWEYSDTELSYAIVFLVNLVMIGIGVLLVRRVFVVFGAMGAVTYLGHLASSIFEDSWLFPISLTAIGLLIIFLGVQWQKNERKITKSIRGKLPSEFGRFLDSKLG